MESLTSKLHAKLQAFINGKRRSAASRIVSPVSRLAKPAASLAGFTLVEMLAVVTLIFILIGVSLSLTRIADRKARESRARADIKAIENALELYKADYGGYPPLDPDRMNGAGSFPYISTGFYDHYTYNYTYYTSISWMNTISLYQALTTNGPKTYLAFKPDQIKGTNISGTTYYYLVDPWDNPYGYNPRDPQVNGGSFDIWSAGPDWYSAYPCKSNQVDDIGNWTK